MVIQKQAKKCMVCDKPIRAYNKSEVCSNCYYIRLRIRKEIQRKTNINKKEVIK